MTSFISDPQFWWSENVQRFMRNQPVIGNIYSIISLVVGSVLFIKLVAPRISAYSRDIKLDYRPIFLVFNGFWFGVSGAGVPMILTISGSGNWDMFQMVDRDSTELRDMAVKHLAYVFALTCLFDMGKSLLATCSGKPDRLVSDITLLHRAAWSLVIILSVALYPVGTIGYVGAVYCLYRCFYYGYLVMTCTSAEMKLQSLKQWKTNVEFVQLIAFMSIFVHQLYFYLNTPSFHQRLASALIASYSGLASMAIGYSLIPSTTPTMSTNKASKKMR